MNGPKLLTAFLAAATVLFCAAAPTFSGGKGAHWSYGGKDGPAHWGDLSGAYEVCKTGHQQSPINIGRVQQTGLAALETSYLSTPLRIINNGHTIQVDYAPGSTMELGGSAFDLLQFHFHSPSENTVAGKHFDMEVHFVHKNGAGQLGVLGVFIKSGAANAALAKIWAHLPRAANSAAAPAGKTVNGSALLPASKAYYRFVGSLTTPPCSEGVQWHVAKQPITASPQQISEFVKLIGTNNRPVQDFNSRLLMLSE